MTHLDYVNAFIALWFTIAVIVSALKTRRTKSRGGVSWFTILSALVFNMWFVYFYIQTGFLFVAICEVFCVISYIWWYIEFLRADDEDKNQA